MVFRTGSRRFLALEEPTACRGLEEALGTVAQTLNKLGPFDGILGFSQGAALAALVCPWPRAVIPASLCPGLSLLVSGFCPRGLGLMEPIMQGPCHCLPSMFGDTDGVIPSQESMQLCSRFDGAVTLTHSGGHFIQQPHLQRQATSSWTSLQTESSVKAFAFASPFHSTTTRHHPRPEP